MLVVRHILLLALAFILQTTWVDSLKVWSIKPDLLIMTLSFIALRSGPVVGAYMGLGSASSRISICPLISESMRLPSRLSAQASATATLAWSPTASKFRPRWFLVP